MPTVYSPAVSTYAPLATYTVTGSPDSEVIFSSIPAYYRDLILVIQGGISPVGGVTVSVEVYINGDTSNGSLVFMRGDTGGDASGTATRIFASLGDENSMSIIQFMDYSATDKHKTVLIRDSSPGSTKANACRWASNTAMNSVTLTDAGGADFIVGSTFSLYGIAA
jgi:hypothetical protein